MNSFHSLLATSQTESDACHSDEEGVLVGEQVQSSGCCNRCKEQLQSFWRISANIQHESSQLSRRKFLPIVLPMVALIFLLFNVYRALSCHQCVFRHFIVLLDFGLFLILLMVWVLPIQNVWIDVFVVVSLLAYTVSYRSVVQDDLPFELLWTALLCQVGVRSGLVLVYGIISCCYIGIFEMSLGVFSLSYVVVVVSLAFSFDGNMTAMSAELQESKSTMFRLLEHASHGFCKVDLGSGVIQTASESLHQSLRTESLQGVSLLDLIKKCHAPEIHAIYVAAARGVITNPSAVTCHIQGSQEDFTFEAKIIPFRLSKDSLEICFQACTRAERIPPSNDSLYHLSSTTDEVSWDVTPDLSIFQRLVDFGVQTDSIEPRSSFPRSATASHPSGVLAFPRPAQREKHSTLSKASDRSSSSGGSRGRSPRGHERSSPALQLGTELEQDGEVTPYLSTFKPTPVLTCIVSAAQLFKHWNLPKARHGCCPWHASLDVVLVLLKAQKKSECEPLWSPYCGWQCEVCQAMNPETALCCQLCNKANPTMAARSMASRHEFSLAIAEILSNADNTTSSSARDISNSSSADRVQILEHSKE